jgi:DsbC/DsbD-like thiol-disulfide interchange protein
MLARFGRFGHPLSSMIPGVFFCAAALMLPATALAAPDAALIKSVHMRLVAAAGLEQGIYHAAAEIELPPKAITYWRQPGEAGVPPKFSFEGSENVAAAEALSPPPSRLEEGGLEAFGYRGGAVFPIHVTPKDAAKPSVLKLRLDYAVCEQICVPVRSDAEIILPQQSAAADELVAAAEARLPMKLAGPDRLAKAAIAPQSGAAKPTWTLTWKDGNGLDDLFIEAPDGWYFETRKVGAQEFLLVAADAPAGAAAKPVDVHITAVAPRMSYEWDLTLDPVATQR